jgi:hypothetical protein
MINMIHRLLLIVIILANVVLLSIAIPIGIFSVRANGWGGLICPAGWIFWIIICNLDGLKEIRPPYKALIAYRGITPGPRFTTINKYYRVVKNRSWWRIILEIDEAIEKPNADVVAVAFPIAFPINSQVGGFSAHWAAAQERGYLPVLFMWNDRYYSGWLRE